jgi:hypothetical protein
MLLVQPLRVRRFGDSESWRAVAMFDAAAVSVEDLREEIVYGESGPGQSFASAPSIQQKGRFVFVHQSGGLDV